MNRMPATVTANPGWSEKKGLVPSPRSEVADWAPTAFREGSGGGSGGGGDGELAAPGTIVRMMMTMVGGVCWHLVSCFALFES